MSRLHKIFLVVGGLALLASVAFSWNFRRELQAARQELQAVIKSNEFLKKTLGEMTVAITAKDKEIDRLRHLSCEGQDKPRSSVPIRPGRNSVSHPSAIRTHKGSVANPVVGFC